MIHSVSFTSAALEDFAEANLWLLVSALAKKNKKKKLKEDSRQLTFWES